MLISDAFQGHGLGTELLRELLNVARTEKLAKVVGDILPENTQMLSICRLMGFQLRHSPEEEVVKTEIAIN